MAACQRRKSFLDLTENKTSDPKSIKAVRCLFDGNHLSGSPKKALIFQFICTNSSSVCVVLGALKGLRL